MVPVLKEHRVTSEERDLEKGKHSHAVRPTVGSSSSPPAGSLPRGNYPALTRGGKLRFGTREEEEPGLLLLRRLLGRARAGARGGPPPARCALAGTKGRRVRGSRRGAGSLGGAPPGPAAQIPAPLRAADGAKLLRPCRRPKQANSWARGGARTLPGRRGGGQDRRLGGAVDELSRSPAEKRREKRGGTGLALCRQAEMRGAGVGFDARWVAPAGDRR
ncbi:uncharacterized protein LOC125444396 [Sphaerodactylus townsendi]|uniref:uncharacterized protein LOC125444396 n=1 Tax=Sphaerodactylus townsendi TaxID=933632 RepID=UPI002026340B|nr:uncharacterized protein LOC125444396 [Sphaerodactylus townsendi]